MSNEPKEVRCKGCGRLLAKIHDGQLTIQRGDLTATFEGAFRAAIVCSQSRCRQTNSVDVLSQAARKVRFSV